ncbi:protein YgfX [Shewanella glacialipiscicola]|uniref:protein YgfX n=1 Tax=Shewanella glacialipiscicola TaxID=614069 RepID=UPI003D7B2ED8
MADQHPSFSVKASLDQRLSLVVFVCVCSSAFLLWPQSDTIVLSLLKYFFIALVCIFLLWQLWRLQHWRLGFMLNDKGEGRLSTGEHFKVLKRTWVTPFVCLIYIEVDAEQRLLMVWADMLVDTDYRLLCRLLLRAKIQQTKSSSKI